MFNRLRVRLTLLYLGAGALLALAIGVCAYGLVSYYFLRSTERALQHIMAEHMDLLGAPLPPELEEAEEAWYSGSTGLLPAKISEGVLPYLEGSREEETGEIEIHESPEEHALDADLAAIFVLALDENGRMLPGFNTEVSPLQPDREAVELALVEGNDWRTVRADGVRVRLLTYRMEGLTQPKVLQVGRSLSDQDRMLQALVIGLVLIGGIGMVGLGSASWWLAGRSLVPMEEAWQRQQAFVANASHELRTPLTLVRSSAEVARRGLPPDSHEAELVEDILQESDHMSRLIEDQLMLSRLDAEELPLTLQPLPLAPMVEELVRQVRRLPEARARQIDGEVSPEAWIRADSTRIRQVLLILLDNALQHTAPGDTIQIDAKLEGQWVLIQVMDSGEGIPPEDLDHVVDRFYRADKARSRSQGHSGLGLSIATALVEAHRGSLEVSSELGVGTTIQLRLPALARTTDE